MSWKQTLPRQWGLTRKTRVPSVLVERPVSDLPAVPSSSVDETVARADSDASGAAREAKVRSWRRRVLLKRGVRMHASMVTRAQDCSLAMLDDTGVVVSWFGRSDGNDRPADQVVDRHMAQFYLAQDIGSEQPLRDLHDAIVDGSSTRQGWRLRAEGTAVWATTIIEAVTLRDGRLQGFSYLTRQSQGPSDRMPIAQSLDIAPEQRDSATQGAHRLTLLPARNRMAGSSAYARQRRVFRLAIRGMQH